MAETASVLCPDKKVLIADLGAGCSLAESITADQLRAWKAEHPGAVVVMYVNTSAEVKAETDYCCTSGNAVQIVEHILREHGEDTEILFGPDMWLGAFVERETGIREDPDRRARFHIWDGECHVHAGIRPDDIKTVRDEHPNAEFLIHPECGCATQAMEYVASGDIDPEGVQMLSTGGMLKYMEKHPEGEYIVATENGMLYPLHQAAPHAKLIEANRMAFCKFMKMITLPKVRDSLRDFKYEVKVPPRSPRGRSCRSSAWSRSAADSSIVQLERCNSPPCGSCLGSSWSAHSQPSRCSRRQRARSERGSAAEDRRRRRLLGGHLSVAGGGRLPLGQVLGPGSVSAPVLRRLPPHLADRDHRGALRRGNRSRLLRLCAVGDPRGDGTARSTRTTSASSSAEPR